MPSPAVAAASPTAPPRRAPSFVRWLGFVLLLKAVLMAAALCGALVSQGLMGWGLPGAGMLGAAAVVAATFRWAPSHRRLCGTVMLGLGAWAAWALLRPPSMAPESWMGEPYADSWIPIVSTYAGGLSSWVLCLRLRCVRDPPEDEDSAADAS